MITCQVVKYYSCFHDSWKENEDGTYEQYYYKCELRKVDKNGDCIYMSDLINEICTNPDAIEYAEKKYKEKNAKMV